MKFKPLVLIVLSLAFVGIASASANSLITTSPTSGSTLSKPPTSITLSTQRALIPDANELVVTNAAGIRVDDGTITVNGISASIGVKPLTESGIYRVSYRLFSEGDLPLEGSFTFNFSAPSVITPVEPSPTPTQSQSQTPASSSWGTSVFIIVILVIAFLVLIGLILYARKIFRDR